MTRHPTNGPASTAEIPSEIRDLARNRGTAAQVSEIANEQPIEENTCSVFQEGKMQHGQSLPSFSEWSDARPPDERGFRRPLDAERRLGRGELNVYVLVPPWQGKVHANVVVRGFGLEVRLPSLSASDAMWLRAAVLDDVADERRKIDDVVVHVFEGTIAVDLSPLHAEVDLTREERTWLAEQLLLAEQAVDEANFARGEP